jgi:hypothetical protein
MALLEQITKSFSKFKSSPITYIMFLVVIGFSHSIWSNNKDKDKRIADCESDRNRIHRKLEDIALKVNKVEQNDSVISKTAE